MFSQIRPSVSSNSDSDHERESDAERAHLIPHEDETNDRDGTATEVVSRKAKRSLGIGLSLLAGLFYGVTFVPVVYIQDHKEDVSLSSSNGNFISVFSFEILQTRLSHMPFLTTVVYTRLRPQLF